jgi:hypothetical protein
MHQGVHDEGMKSLVASRPMCAFCVCPWPSFRFHRVLVALDRAVQAPGYLQDSDLTSLVINDDITIQVHAWLANNSSYPAHYDLAQTRIAVRNMQAPKGGRAVIMRADRASAISVSGWLKLSRLSIVGPPDEVDAPDMVSRF